MQRTKPSSGAVAGLLFVALAAYALMLCLPTFRARLLFPGVLQHQEGQTIYILHRTSESLANLYTTPSIDAASLVYNPAYYLYLWILHPLLGDQIVPIRVASVLAPLIISLILVELIGLRHMKVRWLGAVTAAIWLVVHPRFAWIDLARLDAMFLLSIVGVWFAMCFDDDGKAKQWTVGAAITFAFAVKQQGALLVAAPLMLGLADRRYLVGFAVSAFGCGAVVLVAWLTYGADYIDWAFREPSSHPFSIADGLNRLSEFAISLLFVFVAVPALGTMRSDLQSPEIKLSTIALLTFVGCFMSAGKDGGSFSNFHVFVLMGSIAAARVLVGTASLVSTRAQLAASTIGLLLIWCVASNELAFSRARVTPTKADVVAQTAFANFLRRIPGESWTTTWPQADLWAGHPIKAPIQSRRDLDSNSDMGERAVIESRRFLVIFTSDALDNRPVNIEVRRHYAWCFATADYFAFRTIAGRMFHPTDAFARSPEDCAYIRALAASAR